jgi:hypothetical protein
MTMFQTNVPSQSAGAVRGRAQVAMEMMTEAHGDDDDAAQMKGEGDDDDDDDENGYQNFPPPQEDLYVNA